MDIQSKKLSFIEWLVGVKDEALINALDRFRKKSGSKIKTGLRKISFDDLLAELSKSEDDRRQGKVSAIDEVIKESDTW